MIDLQLWEAFQSPTQGEKVSRTDSSCDSPRDDPFDVTHLCKVASKLHPTIVVHQKILQRQEIKGGSPIDVRDRRHPKTEQTIDGTDPYRDSPLALQDPPHITQRREDPLLQRPRTHRRAGPIYSPQK